MSTDKTWIHRAFPTLAPAEAERCADALPDPLRNLLHDLSVISDEDQRRALDAAAQIYGAVIANLIAEKTRRPDAHRKRWLIWHLSEGDIFRKGTGLRVTRWLNASVARCEMFGFPPGPKERKRRSAIVTEVMKEMRAAVKSGRSPYVLPIHEEEHLRAWADFDALPDDTKTGETVTPSEM